MLSLEGAIAIAADNGAVIECLECFRLVAFSQEHLLTTLAPRLKIIWIRTVLDKTDGLTDLEHVATDHSSYSLAVRPAINKKRLVVGHSWIPANDKDYVGAACKT
jgi:hypothetical protein